LGDLNAGLFYTAAAIASFGVRLVAGRASDRHGRGLFITVSLIFYTLSMLMPDIAISAVAFSSGGSRRVWCWNSDDCSHYRGSIPASRAGMLGLCMAGFDELRSRVLFLVWLLSVGYRNIF